MIVNYRKRTFAAYCAGYLNGYSCGDEKKERDFS